MTCRHHSRAVVGGLVVIALAATLILILGWGRSVASASRHVRAGDSVQLSNGLAVTMPQDGRLSSSYEAWHKRLSWLGEPDLTDEVLAQQRVLVSPGRYRGYFMDIQSRSREPWSWLGQTIPFSRGLPPVALTFAGGRGHVLWKKGSGQLLVITRLPGRRIGVVYFLWYGPGVDHRSQRAMVQALARSWAALSIRGIAAPVA